MQVEQCHKWDAIIGVQPPLSQVDCCSFRIVLPLTGCSRPYHYIEPSQHVANFLGALVDESLRNPKSLEPEV
jgi:hypothetical protein